MKKRIASIICALVAVCTATAQQFAQVHFEIPSNESEFTINYVIPKRGMKEVAFREQDDLYVTKAFSVKSRGHEGVMTYSLFKDTGATEESYRQETLLWTLVCSLNITGESPQTLPAATAFSDQDVQGEFNGDCGTTNLLHADFSTAFLKGYTYVLIESFYKKRQGLVIRTMMAKDKGFFGMQEDSSFTPEESTFSDFYDTFTFHN